MKEESARDALLSLMSIISETKGKDVSDKIDLVKSLSEEDCSTVLDMIISNKMENNKIIHATNDVVMHRYNALENDPKLPEIEKLYMLTADKNKKFVSFLDRQNPTDRICISSSDSEYLKKLYSSKNDKLEIHSDLFFSHQIPLTDCEIEVTFDSDKDGYSPYKSMLYRVLVFDDYAKIIDHSSDNDNINVGCIIIPLLGTPGYIIYPLYIKKGNETIASISSVGYYNMTERRCTEFINTVSGFTFNEGVQNYIGTWYGIQIALLHPQVKEVFQNPEKVRNYSNAIKQPSNNNKKKLRYIKKHVITKDKLEKKMHSDNKNARHALLWHVVGHWRTYKSGKKVFIQPYWKGVLRETKNIETRERELVLPETE